MSLVLITAYAVIFLSALSFFLYLLSDFMEKSRHDFLNPAILHIGVQGADEDEMREINKFIFEFLHRSGTPFSLEAGAGAAGEEIYLSLVTGKRAVRKLKKELEARFSHARVSHSQEPELFISTTPVSPRVFDISLKKPQFVRLRPLENAYFSAFLRVLNSKLPMGESIIFQWVAKPVQPARFSHVRRLFNNLQASQFDPAVADFEGSVLFNKENIRHFRQKIESPLFATNGRVVIFSSDSRANELAGILSRELDAAPHGSGYNHLALSERKNTSQAAQIALSRAFEPEKAQILCLEEMCEIFNFRSDGMGAKVKTFAL